MRSKNIKEIAFRLGIYAGAILGIILMCWNNENNIYYFYLSLLGEIWLFVLIAVFAKKQYVKVMLMVGIIFLIAGKFGLH